MQFIFQPRAQEDAYQIASWHYPPPYDFYDLDQDLEDLAEFLDQETWHEPHYSTPSRVVCTEERPTSKLKEETKPSVTKGLIEQRE